MGEKTYELDWGGKKLTISYGGFAFNATAAVTVRYGDTVVLVTAVISPEPREGIDFFPLTVDFEERFYAAGKITSARFVKRENRPPESAILSGRLIDRPIRPLFPKGFRNDVQIIATILSVDLENDHDIPALVGASAALSLTGAPFGGPIGAVRVGRVEGKLIANPTFEERTKSDLDLIVAGTSDAIMMVEAGASEVTEDTIFEAFDFAQGIIKPVTELQDKMAKDIKPKEMEYELKKSDEALAKEITDKAAAKVREAFTESDNNKRESTIKDLERSLVEELSSPERTTNEIKEAFDYVVKAELRRKILEEGKRDDGRALSEIRPITIQVGILPRTHGSALFTRGETQALSVVTLAGPGQAQIVETMDEEFEKRYMHHYNFPPYSTGEAKPLRGAGRRDIGHGALAERALIPVLPAREDFPYTIRVVSEILSSNGSTSMASVCGSTLSLMDAGVPIKSPVAGVAMGLMTDGKSYKVLTDIRGAEDFAGDMDFKVAGTADGITALQMDMKVPGIPAEVLKDAIAQAKAGRLFILDKIKAVLAAPRPELSPLAPRIYTIEIHPDKIREVIGKGGETINKIIEETGVDIDIEDSGLVHISSPDEQAANKAIEWVKKLTWTPESGEKKIGMVYMGKVTGVKEELGAFVEFLPGEEGLVHISQIAEHRVEKVSDEIKMGDVVLVMLTEVDSAGRNNLSIKAAFGIPAGQLGPVPERRQRR